MEDMKRPFTVHVASIRNTVGAREDVRLSEKMEDLRTSGSAVPEGTPVDFTGAVEKIEGGLVVTGRVHTSWEGECRRCLGVARGEVDVDVREMFEAEPVEGESYPLEHDSVDLEPVVREAVMLELPIAPVCSNDCKGLCPTCGVNRNETACTCDNEVRDPRWSALDSLRSDG
jgi:uncharacterized protein